MKENIETRMMNERLQLEAQLNAHSSAVGDRSKSAGTAALIVGGILVLGYIVGRKLFFSNKKGETLPSEPSTHLMIKAPREESVIVRMIREQMTLFLIAVLKERLAAYINADEHKK
ncbi:MAG: hypothetical protein ACJ75J_09655 [Cytophagaceae bacterium]